MTWSPRFSSRVEKVPGVRAGSRSLPGNARRRRDLISAPGMPSAELAGASQGSGPGHETPAAVTAATAKTHSAEPPAPAGTAIDGVRTPAGNSAIARHRQPFRRAGLAAVVLRGGLHDGAGVVVAGPRCAARYPVGSPGRAARISERNGYPHFHSPARPHLCREVTSVFTDIIHRLMHRLLRWQGKRAAGEREAGEKAVISRCTSPAAGRR